jgi:hypothetical protein
MCNLGYFRPRIKLRTGWQSGKRKAVRVLSFLVFFFCQSVISYKHGVAQELNFIFDLSM